MADIIAALGRSDAAVGELADRLPADEFLAGWAERYGDALTETLEATRRLLDERDRLRQALEPFTRYDLHATQHIAGLEHDGHKLRAVHVEDCWR